MKTGKTIGMLLTALLLASLGITIFTVVFHSDWIVAGLPSDKDYSSCTGHETVGRCADKCADGSQPLDFDSETGAAICAAVGDCPYTQALNAGPECDKLAPQPAEIPADTADFGGK